MKRSSSGKLARSLQQVKVKRRSSGKLDRSLQKGEGEEKVVRKAEDVSPEESCDRCDTFLTLITVQSSSHIN